MPDRLGDTARLQHIKDAVEQIEQFVEGVDFEVFSTHSMMFSACVRQLEIIGEAANHISARLQLANPQVAWSSIIALRNILAHQYFGIDEIVIWKIIAENLPVLKRQIGEILEVG
jgi:uncharacterized protein with HEPN domain